MSPYGAPRQLEKISGLGEVLVVYLDVNEFKTFGMPNPDMSIPEIISDLTYNTDPISQQYGNPHMQPSHTPQYSIADELKFDLIRIMKEDKKTRSIPSSGSTGAVMAAVKGKDLIKKGFGKLKHAAKKKLFVDGSNYASEYGMGRTNHELNMNGEDPPGNDSAVSYPISKNLYYYDEGYDNEVCEEEIRFAFTTFFLVYVGDIKQFLRPRGAGQHPIFDKDMFKMARVKVGERQNTPMYKLTVHFKESQILEQFVIARVQDISQKKEYLPRLSPLFLIAMKHLNLKQMSFQILNVRRVLRHYSGNRPVIEYINVVKHVRHEAIYLTSTQRHESSAMKIKKLVQECRECGIHLTEVMNVIWERLRDSRGSRWKQGSYALQIVLELILHGPLAAVTEAMDGLDQIRRIMKSYEHSRSSVVQDMRTTAAFVHNLLVNRSRLFAMRRICAQKRQDLIKPIPLKRDERYDVVKHKNRKIKQLSFKKLHDMIKPGTTIGSTTSDLLGFETAEPAPQQPIQPFPLADLMSNTSISLQQNSHPVSGTVVQPIVSVAPAAPTSPVNPPLSTQSIVSPAPPTSTSTTNNLTPVTQPTISLAPLAPTLPDSNPPSSVQPKVHQPVFPQQYHNTSPPKMANGQQPQHYNVPQQLTQAPLSPNNYHPQQLVLPVPMQQHSLAPPLHQGFHHPQSYTQQNMSTNFVPQYNNGSQQQQPQLPNSPPKSKPSSQFDPFA